jgi:hypothetical protein
MSRGSGRVDGYSIKPSFHVVETSLAAWIQSHGILAGTTIDWESRKDAKPQGFLPDLVSSSELYVLAALREPSSRSTVKQGLHEAIGFSDSVMRDRGRRVRPRVRCLGQDWLRFALIVSLTTMQPNQRSSPSSNDLPEGARGRTGAQRFAQPRDVVGSEWQAIVSCRFSLASESVQLRWAT